MGGPGSGRRYRLGERKITVEECLTVSSRDLHQFLYNSATGTISWTWQDGRIAVVEFLVGKHEDSIRITGSGKFFGRS